MTLHDIGHCVLTDAERLSDLAIRPPLFDQLKDLGRQAVGFNALAGPPAKLPASGLGGGHTGADALA